MRQVLTDVGELPLALVVQFGSCGVAGLDVDGCLRHGRTDWVTGGMGSAGACPLPLGERTNFSRRRSKLIVRYQPETGSPSSEGKQISRE